MLSFRPEFHHDEYHHGRAPAGRSVVGPAVTVGQDEEGEPTVVCYLDPLHAETIDDRDVVRRFTIDEARAFAAALRHAARQCERTAGLR
jgi:hypothetical protein